MEEAIMQDLWSIKRELNALRASLTALEAVYGNSEQIPHKAMEIAFGWEKLEREVSRDNSN